MDPYELTAVISAMAIVTAKNTPDDKELAVIALALGQLADTLNTIVAQRALLKNEAEEIILV